MTTDTFHYFSIHDTSVKPYCLPDNFRKPEKWVEKENSRIEYELYGGVYNDTFDLQDALEVIDSARNFETICSAKSWCLKNYQTVFPHLVTRLSIKQKVGLENTADLIIMDRIGTGELEFYGHGGAIEEDIFTIAGRVSWILNELTGENFAVVHGNMSERQAQDFKKLWLAYINQLKH
ncbi:MAG TPA: hypothetical protein DIW47_01165 [Bacteroidetes bacterium]|nr:hypothetical protein [Bacteroidota bacterium]